LDFWPQRLAAAPVENTVLLMTDAFIYTLANGFHSLIDGRSFLKRKLVPIELAHEQCRAHIAAILKQQDGGNPQNRTLAERRNLFVAMP
jgi:hypothetical protein